MTRTRAVRSSSSSTSQTLTQTSRTGTRSGDGWWRMILEHPVDDNIFGTHCKCWVNLSCLVLAFSICILSIIIDQSDINLIIPALTFFSRILIFIYGPNIIRKIHMHDSFIILYIHICIMFRREKNLLIALTNALKFPYHLGLTLRGVVTPLRASGGGNTPFTTPLNTRLVLYLLCYLFLFNK